MVCSGPRGLRIPDIAKESPPYNIRRVGVGTVGTAREVYWALQ